MKNWFKRKPKAPLLRIGDAVRVRAVGVERTLHLHSIQVAWGGQTTATFTSDQDWL